MVDTVPEPSKMNAVEQAFANERGTIAIVLKRNGYG
jgi:hypothetical protein